MAQQDPKGIYITYSANEGQTIAIEKVYKAGGWDTKIFGANQAAAIKEMENLLRSDAEYKSLQGIMKIAPLTTIPNNNELTAWTKTMNTDLSRIKSYLEGSNIVFGWKNQESDPLYAHCLNSPTGVVANFPKQITDLVQNTLSQFATDYKVMPAIKD